MIATWQPGARTATGARSPTGSTSSASAGRCSWAASSPSLPRDARIGADSTVLALRARFDARAAEGLRATYALRLGEDRFRVAVSDDEIELARGDAHRPDATIDTDPGTLAAV